MFRWHPAVAWICRRTATTAATAWGPSSSTSSSCRRVCRTLSSASTAGALQPSQQLQPGKARRLLQLQRCLLLRCSPAAPAGQAASSCSYAASHVWSTLQRRHSSSSNRSRSSATNTAPTSTAQLPGCVTACAEVAGQQYTFETGVLAHLAPGAVLMRAGNNTVLATVCVNTDSAAAASAAGDGPQLQVEYRERLVAVGQLPSRADRRDPGGSEREVLGGRLVDRALRPLLPPGWAAPTQVVVTLLSCDGAVDPLVLAINAASAAALVAGLPLAGPAAAVQVVALEAGGALRLNPPAGGLPPVGGGTRLSLLYAGTHGQRVTALEAAGNQVPEAEVVEALEAAAAAAQPLLVAQQELAAAAAAAVGGRRPTWPGAISWPPAALLREVQGRAGPGCAALLQGRAGAGKATQGAALAALGAGLQREMVAAGLLPDQHSLPGAPGMYTPQQVAAALDLTLSRTMRDTLLAAATQQPPQPAAPAAAKGHRRSKGSKAQAGAATEPAEGPSGAPGVRLDGRALPEVRPLTALAGPLPRRVHGSALFSRGDTQSLASVTVGSPREGLGLDTVLGRSEPRFHLHYTFPPYSTGEVGLPRASAAPNRREVGHGALAAKALAPLLRLTSPGNAVTDSALVADEDPNSSRNSSPGGNTPPGGSRPSSRSSKSTRASSSSPSSAAQEAGGGVGGQEEGEEFPFAVRVVVDTLASSGSSSMAAVCSGALALKTAGVPLTALAAGISIGCIVANPPHLPQEPPDLQQWTGPTTTPAAPAAGGSQKAPGPASPCGPFPTPYGPALLLVDIAGSEDHLGDMDFKVAGTAAGITALQLDTKLPGLPLALVTAALGPAAGARRQVLGVMEGAWAAWEVAIPGALRARHGTTTINRELVPRLVGLQGCNLAAIEEVTGGRLVVGDTGEVGLYAPTAASYDHALEAVAEVEGRSFRKGETVRVRVLQLKDYGALVQLPNGMPALLHISELSHARVREVGDVVVEGQEVQVLVKGRDSRGQLLLSRKALLPLIPQPAGDTSQAATAEEQG